MYVIYAGFKTLNTLALTGVKSKNPNRQNNKVHSQKRIGRAATTVKESLFTLDLTFRQQIQ